MASAQQLLDVARAELGYREGPNNWTRYSAEMYGGRYQNQAWCGVFVGWCFSRVGMGSEPSSVWTPAGAVAYQRAGRLISRYGAVQPGDVVYFDWGGSQTLSRIDHVGFVETVGNGSVTTIEGNTLPAGQVGDQSNGGGVYRRQRPLGTIACFGRPLYGAANQQAPQNLDWAALRRFVAAKILSDGIANVGTLRRGSAGSKVRLWQQALNLIANARLVEDGHFGPSTQAKTYDFQRYFGIQQDGVVGPQTLGLMVLCLQLARDGKA